MKLNKKVCFKCCKKYESAICSRTEWRKFKVRFNQAWNIGKVCCRRWQMRQAWRGADSPLAIDGNWLLWSHTQEREEFLNEKCPYLLEHTINVK